MKRGDTKLRCVGGSVTFTADATAGGPYNVAASVSAVANPANFSLTNTVGPPAKVVVTSGSGQSTTVNTAFSGPLAATVTDAGNNPVNNVVVTFTAPGSGASGTFAGGMNTATTNVSGAATSAAISANSTAGGPYNVVASATGATSANFSLTNLASALASIALVQHTSRDAGVTTSSSLAFVNPNTAGNWIAVLIRAGSSSSQVFSIHGSNSNSYRQAAQLCFTAGDLTMAIYYAVNIMR